MVGAIGKSKKIVTKTKHKRKQYMQAIQNGNHKWITLLACVGVAGVALPLGLIYSAELKNVQSTWMDDIDIKKHLVLVAVLPLAGRTMMLGWPGFNWCLIATLRT